MEFLTDGLVKDIVIGLLGAAIAAIFQRLLMKLRETGLNRRYPVAGRYISYFEDESAGQKFVVKSEAMIHQSGLAFKAVNNIEGGKSWNLEGRIIQKRYLAGAYIAESPYDPGNGTFFLKIDGIDLDGLWSGYDSVSSSITGGRYWFRRIMKMKVVEYQDRYRTSALSIADAVLGAGYLNDLSDGDGFHDVKTILAMESDRVVGFASYSVEKEGYLTSSEKYQKVKFAPEIRSSDKRGLLGHIRIVAVDPAVQGRGIGSALIEQAESELKKLGAQSILVFGWTSPAGTHIGGILARLNYIQMDKVSGFWKEESQRLGYSCAICGNPCVCDVIVFKKATMA
jgi:GNAT superfamily N-acetyltransferase